MSALSPSFPSRLNCRKSSVPVSNNRQPGWGISNQSLCVRQLLITTDSRDRKPLPSSMQPISESLHTFSPLNPHDPPIFLFSRLKPFTIMQNEPVVLLRDVLGVDVRVAWLPIRRER
ncbi:hypothetical protein K503DRAFT_635142 [Rhizopogon vinicolor AM-OR11-026]|uniref:Uncharacterized protein n=1 Tax=Rhizopogon vinicolor AM-OR11-026 TaxID=1314800 RepID=A0A1B7MHS3_9AGAM|nr:hypothetical protein K503DRAFT_635142 [Rhizopogon vinicolor AM-OR11-026]